MWLARAVSAQPAASVAASPLLRVGFACLGWAAFRLPCLSLRSLQLARAGPA